MLDYQRVICHRGPNKRTPDIDAVVVQVGGPGRSGNAGIGSHLAATNAAESHAGQVERSGMSGKCRNRLTPGRGGCRRGPYGAGGVPPGANENGQVGRLDFGKGKARAAFPIRLGRG